MSLVQLSRVEQQFGDGATVVRALREIDLSIDEGEFVALMGPSGSGKSTLLTILGAMMNPSSGQVIVDDIDIYALGVERLADFRREYLGFVFQHLYLVPYLSAAENVMLPLAAGRVANGEQRDRAQSALARVGLADKGQRLPSELSGGEQQRVAIARAIVNQPPLLLADEPTGCLDSATGKEILKLLLDLKADGLTVFMVTHDAAIASHADRIVRLRDGALERLAA
jgi:putative ABC transport system ATP-binding protein